MAEDSDTRILDTELTSSKIYANAFNLLFWGFLAYLLIPVAGNILIAIASGRLRGLHKKARMIHIIAWAFVPLNALIILMPQPLPLTRIGATVFLCKVLWIAFVFAVVTISGLIMIWMLSGMVADLARHFGDNRLVIRTLFRRKALLMFLILLYIEVAGLYFATNMAVIMIFATMIPTAIFYFATAWLFSHAENLLKQCGNAGNSDVTQTSE